MIIIDPPTISRSKKMDQLFEIQTDYINLISKALGLLLKNGFIFFSTTRVNSFLRRAFFLLVLFWRFHIKPVLSTSMIQKFIAVGKSLLKF